MSCKYVVAAYDFRSKQEYIYRTNKIKEIMGASEIIKYAYQHGISSYKMIDSYKGDKEENIPDFSLESFQKATAKGKTGTVLYEGGGNIVILFISKEECIKFNKHFSLFLLKEAPGITPTCKMAEFDDLKHKKFSEVRKEVFSNMRESNQIPWPTLYANVFPFTQIDRKTSLPIVSKEYEADLKCEAFSAESLKKREAFKRINHKEEGLEYAKHPDQIVEKKGKESLMAIIYIDGNDLGQYVRTFVNDDILFEEGVMKSRCLAAKINDIFVNRTMKAINEHTKELSQEKKATCKHAKVLAMRRIVGAGDEIAIICNARNVLTILKSYFAEIKKEDFSACAGVAVCHSHAPYAKVYAIAEECCQNGKNRRKAFHKDKDRVKNSYVDAYFCRGAITGDLAVLREGVGMGYSNMPYCMDGCDEPDHMFEDKFIRIGNELKKLSRTNVKVLRDAAYKSKAEFELELLQIKSNCGESVNIEAADRTAFCDTAEFYDIWFREEDLDV